jgi:hypothetical protein
MAFAGVILLLSALSHGFHGYFSLLALRPAPATEKEEYRCNRAELCGTESGEASSESAWGMPDISEKLAAVVSVELA